MTRQDQIDIEDLMRPHWRRLFFALAAVVGTGLIAAFAVGQMVSQAKAALSDLSAQVTEMQAVRDELIGIVRRMDGIEAQMRVHGNDLQWIKDAIKNGGGK